MASSVVQVLEMSAPLTQVAWPIESEEHTYGSRVHHQIVLYLSGFVRNRIVSAQKNYEDGRIVLLSKASICNTHYIVCGNSTWIQIMDNNREVKDYF